MKEKEIFFESLKENKKYWVNNARNGFNKKDEFDEDMNLVYEKLKSKLSSSDYELIEKIVSKSIDGFIHTLLVTFDNGTDLSNKFIIDIINKQTNKSISDNNCLHEEYDFDK